jgi:hypothetical protein
VGGQGADPRIDLYAFGCIAHELVVGMPPFAGKTIQVMNAHLTLPPPRASERRQQAGIPVELDEIILRLLEKDPDRRIQSGRDLGLALRAVPGFPDDRASVPRRRPSVAPMLPQRDTTHGMPTALAMAETLHGDATLLGDRIDPDEARVGVEVALVQLAESLIDHGHDDSQLGMTLAEIAIVRGTLEHMVARMIELQRAGNDAEQRGRELETRLSFAIGEMRFDAERVRAAGGQLDPDVAFQISQLERRHAEVIAERERELHAINERAVALAADQHHYEDQLAQLHARLSAAVDAHATRFAGNPTVRDLGERLARSRALLERAGGR